MSRTAAALAFLCGFLVACAEPPARVPRGVVLLMLDTVRADHLSVYGYGRDTTPNLERLAARGTTFEAVQSCSPWTVPTMASLWTGKYPVQHGAGVTSRGGEPREFKGPRSFVGFATGTDTLPARLASLGYRGYLRGSNVLLRHDCFTEDFEETKIGVSSADEIVDWALERMDALEDGKFFLYLHFMDTHAPLRAPRKELTRYVENPPGRDEYAAFEERVRAWDGFYEEEKLRSPERDRAAAERIAAYDGTLHFLDREIGRMVDAFEARGLLQETLFVVTADHGEELWDHWETELEVYDVGTKPKVGVSHGHTLFQELLRVPLILAGPGVPAGRRLAEPVRHIDLGPTVLELVGRSRSSSELGEANSLVPLLRGEGSPFRELYSEGLCYGYELLSLVDADGYKLIRATHEGERDLLFHLPTDPDERNDLLEERPAEAARLTARLEELRRDLAKSKMPQGERATKVDRRELQALGYVGGEED